MPESSARAVLLNRILIALGLVGLYISGYLSLVKFLKVLPSCGVTGGCMAVTDHPLAFWFEQPVAYFGLAGFLAITMLAIIREFTGRELSKPLVGIGLILSLGGLFASIYLQYVALFVIRETCYWCLSSAGTMLGTFIVHAFLFGEASDAESPIFRPRMKAVPFVLGGLIVTGTAIAMTKTETGRGPDIKSAPVVKGIQLIPDRANILGNPEAPVTIVEFADFCCPKCRTTAMSTRGLAKKYPDKVRFVFRHFPLTNIPGHEMAYPLAIASEFAAKQGKFWAFHEAAMTAPQVPKTIDEVLSIARGVGLDETELSRIVDGQQDSPEFDRVYRDFTEAPKLGAQGTPTFFVLVPGKEAKIVNVDALEKALETGEFAAYVR